MTLDDLKASAPRSFDKTLIELLVAIQQGGQPIVVEDTEATSRIATLESQVHELSQALVDAASRNADVINDLLIQRQKLEDFEAKCALLERNMIDSINSVRVERVA